MENIFTVLALVFLQVTFGQRINNGPLTSIASNYFSPVNNLPGIGNLKPGRGGLNPGYSGLNPGYGGLNFDLGGLNSGFGGLNPGFGGLNPSLGGLNPSLGGLNPDVSGVNRVLGGLNPALGGLKPVPITASSGKPIAVKSISPLKPTGVAVAVETSCGCGHQKVDLLDSRVFPNNIAYGRSGIRKGF